MMKLEMQKRIITSICLFFLLILMYYYNFILIISLILIAISAWIEFNFLIIKILKKKNNKNKILKFLSKTISLIFFTILIYTIIIIKSLNSELKDALIYIY